MSHYSPVSTSFARERVSYGTKVTDERQFPGSIPGQSMRESTSPHNVVPSRNLDSRLDRRNSGPSTLRYIVHFRLGDYNSGFSFPGERSNIGIPPVVVDVSDILYSTHTGLVWLVTCHLR